MSITLMNQNICQGTLDFENIEKSENLAYDQQLSLIENIQYVSTNSDQTQIQTSNKDKDSQDEIQKLGKRQRDLEPSKSSKHQQKRQRKSKAQLSRKNTSQNDENSQSVAPTNDGADSLSKLNSSSNQTFNEVSDDEDSRERRLVQNRKSAMKCRMKKKNEYEEMKTELDNLKAQGVELNIKFKNTCLMYEDKIKENEELKKKLDLLQTQQTMMLAYVLSQQQNKTAPSSSSPSLISQIQTVNTQSDNSTSTNEQTSSLPQSMLNLEAFNPLAFMQPQLACLQNMSQALNQTETSLASLLMTQQQKQLELANNASQQKEVETSQVSAPKEQEDCQSQLMKDFATLQRLLASKSQNNNFTPQQMISSSQGFSQYQTTVNPYSGIFQVSPQTKQEIEQDSSQKGSTLCKPLVNKPLISQLQGLPLNILGGISQFNQSQFQNIPMGTQELHILEQMRKQLILNSTKQIPTNNIYTQFHQ
eukprot:403342579